ncbi:MAG: methyltransferase domain-containing protein [Candidatus Thermoplasmatota archaeon]|nr:methyltransferase domain-containing protein [Candidatus Thermoplasmatota archaeon]
MRWKLKAKIQNAVSLFPSSASYATYYWIQRHFGGLRRLNPISRLTAAIETWKRIQEQGVIPSGKVFLEVGTGRVPLVPLAYWLIGAEKTITMDLNPYLKAELVGESIQYISENKEKILNLFGSLIDKKRFDELQSLSRNSHFSVSAFLDLCQVDYVAPIDAADTRFSEQCIDFHTSYTVFEHIPLEVLKQILNEGNRIIKNNGLFVHRIDYSDHFSHSDKSISAINFLQYSDNEWEKFAGNRYMYMNRLRHDDFISLFKSVGHHIMECQPNTDQRLQKSLRNGSLQLDNRFSSKSEDVLAITGAWNPL